MLLVFLIISELPIFRGYFDHNWPLLGQESGFVTLALAMVILGVTVLGDLNTPAASQEALSLPFWRIVVSSGILAMVLGVLNFVAVSAIHSAHPLEKWISNNTFSELHL